MGALPEDIEKAATSILQQRAAEVRSNKINWQSYLQSQMMSQDDFTFISRFDGGSLQERDRMIQENPSQCAKTFYNLLGHISKDQTIQYLLTLVDDFLQEKKQGVAIFREYARKRKESIYTQFLNLLNRPDGFIQNMSARVI